MVICGGFVFPHGAITLDPETRDLTQEPAYLPTTKENCITLHAAMKFQAQTLIDSKPDLIIFATPHGLKLQNSFLFLGNNKAFGTAEWDGKWADFTAGFEVDKSLSEDMVATLRSSGSQVELLTMGSEDDALPLRWAEVIPFWFIKEAATASAVPMPPAVCIGIPTRRSNPGGSELMIPDLLILGSRIWDYIKTNLEEKRVAIVISCDLSHYHSTEFTSPYPFDKDAIPFDNLCVDWSKIDIDEKTILAGSESNQKIITECRKLVDHIGTCGYTGLVLLQGILTANAADFDVSKAQKFKAYFFEYSWPTYYGMMVNHFLPI